MGIAPDLIAEVIYGFVMPEIIQQKLDRDLFLALEIIAMHLTGYLGNGLYNLGGFLLTILAINQRVITSWVAIWAVIAWMLGLCLSASLAFNAVKSTEIFTILAMVLSTTWMLVFAHKVIKNSQK